MSKEFYNYLADKLVAGFDAFEIGRINKYILKLDTVDDVVRLSDALVNILASQNRLSEFVYFDKNSVEPYKTYLFCNQNGTKIIVVPEINIQPAFMTRLRNINLDGDFLLFICHNPIDSIVGGMEDLQKEGMPFHRDRIFADIENRLKYSQLKSAECEVLKYALELQKQKDKLDDYSLHDFENILAVIYREHIQSEDFQKFGLFSDMELVNTISSGENYRARIEDNHHCYREVNESVRLGDPASDLAGRQSEPFISRVKSNINKRGTDEWDYDISYEYYKKEQSKLKKAKDKFLYRDTSVRRNGGDLEKNKEFFVRTDGEAGAKKKKLNLLIFNDADDKDLFEICVSFTDKGKKNCIDKCFGCEAVFDNKNLLIKVKNQSFQFAKVKLSREYGYEIKICIINCTSDFFSEYRSNYIIKPNKKNEKCCLEIACEESQLVFNRKELENGDKSAQRLLLKSELVVNTSKDTAVILETDEETFSDDNKVSFFLSINSELLPIVFNCSLSKNVSITGSKIEQLILTQQQNFLFFDNRLVFGTDSFNTKEALREALQIEAFLVKNHSMCCRVFDAEHGQMESVCLQVPNSIQAAYDQLIDYYAQKDTLPSLAFYNEELIEIAKRVVNAVHAEFDSIIPGDSIDETTKNILKIGTVDIRGKIAFSAFHPMNIAHQLQLSDETVGNAISEDIIKKLNPDNLIPFIRDNDGKAYVCVTQDQVPQWTYYYPKDEPKNNGKMGFVPRLIKEKIIHFYDHFGDLFNGIGNDKLIINAVNLGDCENLFRGIIEYYKSMYGKNPMNIDVYVYGNGAARNLLDYMSDKLALKNFLNTCGVKDNGKDYSELEFSNYLLDHLKYYKKSMKEKKYHYCHLAFVQMDQEEQEAFSNRDNVISGVMLDGLVAGATSVLATKSGKYRTGYGSQYNVHPTQTIQLANYYNDLMLVSGKSGNPYTPKNCMCTFIADNESEVIEKTYEASNWVVFIDPKVDLHYFKNEKNKDVMIIHYSDQKSTTNGFDAITVTKKTKQYQSVLKDFIEQQEQFFDVRDTRFDNESVKSVIDMFNAINGEWLLKLMSKDDVFRKEKISLLSTSKIMMSLLSKPEIVWIPISMEEIIRVSGAVGLSQREGLFSAKSLGLHGPASDDLLMFGIDLSSITKIKVHLVPVEVKIGYANNNPFEKAKEQIKATRDCIYSSLSVESPNPLMAKFYRNFFAQLAISSADKINLYHIMDIQDYERILNSEIRGRLLNDEFEISEETAKIIGDGIVVAFKNDAIVREVYREDNVTIFKFLESDCYRALAETEATDFVNWLDKMDCIKQFKERQNILNTTSNPQSVLDTDLPLNDNFLNENQNQDGMRIVFGTDLNRDDALLWYPNDTERIMHPNTGIIGTMGTGKTQFTQALIYQLVQEQKNNLDGQPLGILIFDYKGDYNQNKKEFVDATNAKVYELDHLPFNPFSIPTKGSLKPAMPLHIANTFRDTIASAYGLGAIQVDTLRECIMTAYASRGIEKKDRSTWSRPAPTLKDVYNVYCDSENFKRDSLNAALSELVEFEVFEPNPSKVVSLFDFIDGVTVIDLSGYNPSMQNLIVAITLDLFYSQMQATGHSQINGKLRQLTRLILVDEADNFLKLGFSSIRKILKEGREFGVGTILSTQFLTHFYTSDDDYSKYIYSWIVHNVANLSMKDIKNLFNTTTKSQEEELFNSIKKLAKHHSFVKFGDSSQPFYIKDRAFWEIMKEKSEKR